MAEHAVEQGQGPVGHRLREVAALVLVVAAILIGGGVAAGGEGRPEVSQAGSSNSDLNHPAYYENLGYGTCDKVEPVSTPYILGAPPAGTYWRLLVLKAGSAQSNDDFNTLIHNPQPGSFVHPSGKQLSHVIRCYKPGGGPTTTTTTSTTTTPGGGCDEYTPSQVAVNPSTVQQGDSITITGVATPGATVSATLSGSGPPITLGSTTAGGTGQFSITATLPASVGPGTYTISVTSSLCTTPVTITLVVASLTFSGCGSNNDGRTFTPGQQVVWELHETSFDTSKPVQMRLYKSGYSQVLYNGPWPANHQVSLTIPPGAPAGQYTMEQQGTKKNGKIQTKTCPVWVALQSSPAAATTAAPGGSTRPLRGPVVQVGIGALAVFALVQLRRRSGARSPA